MDYSKTLLSFSKDRVYDLLKNRFIGEEEINKTIRQLEQEAKNEHEF
ncbi:MAG: hypothetical protein PHY11_02080 [Bacilli bacterium]|nr:hypothetical protein [Bacilli bacterium]